MKKPATALCIVLCTILSNASCTSYKTLVADAAAAYTYYEARYEQNCVNDKLMAPSLCAIQQQNLKAFERDIKLANEVQKKGKMPKQEEEELKALMKKFQQ